MVDFQQRNFQAGTHLALFVDELFSDLPDNFIGNLSFETQDGSDSLAAVTLRENVNVQGEKICATLPVADLDAAGLASTSQHFLVLPQIGAGSGLSTQVVLINQSGRTIGGEIRLFASEGTPLELELDGVSGSVFPYQIDANGAFRGELTLPAGVGVGYAVVTLTQGTVLPVASAIFQFRSGDRVTSEAGVSATRLTAAARIFVDNAGTPGRRRRTGNRYAGRQRRTGLFG